METSELTATTRYAGRHRIVDHAAPSLPGYDVVEPIGHGGTGTVWSATAPDGRSVAVKVVQAVDVDDALVELAILGRIRDPHLVRLHEALALPSGEVALVLDHLAGGTVGSVVRARGHLRPGEVVTVLSPVAATLARLHGVGIVHGDLSPDNVLLDLDGRPFVSDLGVARIVGEGLAELRGTEGFVAPEVMAGGLPSPASDVHAVGALAWFCLTGEAPGPAVLRGRLGDRAPGVPDLLADAVERALRTRPEDRPDADELAVAVFGSADPEPLVLALEEAGADTDVSLLTRRIRAAARPAAGAGVSGQAHGWVRRGLRGLGAFGDRAWSAGPSAGAGAIARRAVHGLRMILPWVAVVTVVGALVLGFLSWRGDRDEASATSSSGTVTGQASAGGVSGDAGTANSGAPDSRAANGGVADAGTANGGGADPRMAADAASRDPVALAQVLADARADAWSSGVAARLVEVDAPGSPAWVRDAAVLAGVQRSGQRYVGLSFVVRRAEVVAERDDSVTLRTRIDTGAHVVRGPSGEVSRPAVAAAPVLLDLVRTRAGWRVHDVRVA
ncbi:serine/threonine protein kinase [Knoellia locipacati]|uniref:serine/threonine-protein kinase n=1 Tax=Knoellia locipacati TaxID=882824 RepID=UPI00384AB599